MVFFFLCRYLINHAIMSIELEQLQFSLLSRLLKKKKKRDTFWIIEKIVGDHVHELLFDNII